MKVGVVTFPGSNCDYDAYAAVKSVLKEEVEFLCRNLSRVGLMLHVTGCESVEQAEGIVEKAYEWSHA